MFKIPVRFKEHPAVDELQNRFWYVLSLGTPKNLLQAERSLRSYDSHIWLPVFQEYARLRSTLLLVDIPIYPGYAFTGFPDQESVRTARNQIFNDSGGQCTILGEGNIYLEKDELKQVVNVCNSYSSYKRPLSSVKKGDHVTIVSGPLSGTQAEVQRVSQGGKVILLAFFLGREISVETSILDISTQED